ncbi:MAG: bis(5'-nucleosyl)-tetraphosphatase (symmetrical) YqeK [Anaerovoracaceae bacterium]|nr:bis(5'-nucleosyl)-tetraphosphatase (symmetrical) YqeK [Bacillota bacterium]MDY3954817.1 bis(5'-nucleosyl)-tetraphosphatase (symmetrical) YqeK [Anaerovoracaceae bacterium]
MQNALKKQIEERNRENLKEKRLRHVYAVAKLAREMALHYGEDPEKAELAALCHDMFRSAETEVLNDYIKKGGFPEYCLNNSNLAHSKAAVYEMEHKYGITDPDLLNAVSFHTTGRAGMSVLEKIIYLADAAEPGRNYPGVKRLRALLMKDLDRACLQSLSRTVDYVNERGYFLAPDTLEARDDLLQKIKERQRS